MARVGIVGGGSEVVAVAAAAARECGDNEIVVVSKSLGRGYAVLGLPFTEKVNIASQEESFKMFKKALDRAKAIRARLVYAIVGSGVYHTIKRIGAGAWRKSGKVLGQVRLEEAAPEELRGIIDGFNGHGFIVADTSIVRQSRLFLSLVRHLKGVEKVVYTPWFRVEIAEDELRGVATARGYERLDKVVIVGTGRDTLGLGLDSMLPRKVRVEAPLHPPLGWGEFAVITPTVSVLQAEGTAWLSVQVDAAGGGDLVRAAAEAVSRLPALQEAGVSVVGSETIYSSPDSTPLVGRLDSWPEGVYTVTPCLKSCISLAWGIGRSICEELSGGRGEYSLSRLFEKKLFREYLHMP